MERGGLSYQEGEYLAEDTIVEIVPKFKCGIIHLISGDIGPFRPLRISKVPLWVALSFRKKGHCSIILPHWMDTEYLEKRLDEEKERFESFSKIDYYWLEVSRMILEHGGDDSVRHEKIKFLLQQLKEVRFSKIERGLKLLDEGPMLLENIGFGELNAVKQCILCVSSQFREFRLAK